MPYEYILEAANPAGIVAMACIRMLMTRILCFDGMREKANATVCVMMMGQSDVCQQYDIGNQ